MALDQGNHMCDEFWSYNAEFQQVGAQCALLIGGVQHLKPEHLQSFAMRFPNMRRVKHGAAAGEFNGLFMLTDEQRQTQALHACASIPGTLVRKSGFAKLLQRHAVTDAQSELA